MKTNILSALIAGLALAMGFAMPGATRPIQYHGHTASSTAHSTVPSHGLASLPAALVPAVAQILAADSPAIWRSHTVGKHTTVFYNPSQHLIASFNRHGAILQFGDQQHDRIAMQLVAWRSENFVQPITQESPSTKGNRVTLAHGHGFTEWYVNSPLGVEQGFTFDAPSKSTVSGHSQALVFSLHGNLKPVLKNNSLEFKNAAGHGVLRYGDLLAWDARHKALPARMRLVSDRLSISVDTRGASYPVSVDPLFSLTTAFSDPAVTDYDSFGVSVALSANGATALIGADGNAGKVYVYTQTGGMWSTTPVATLTDPAGIASDSFGGSVALSADGTRALIGARNTTGFDGAAYMYSQTGGAWSTTPVATFSDPAATPEDFFGGSVALSADGTSVLIGAGDGTIANKAFAYRQTGGVWSTTPVATFIDPASNTNDNFGISVALSADGSSALIGAYGTVNAAGVAYAYSQTGGVWSTTPIATFTDPLATVNDAFGISVALSADGNSALIGSYGAVSTAGTAYAYSKTGGAWSTTPIAMFTDPLATANDAFGVSVALSADGNSALIGSYGAVSTAGAAYAYSKTGGAWSTTPGATFSDPAATPSDLFGSSVALSANGAIALVGAPWTNNNEMGKAYVFAPSVDLSLTLSSSPNSVAIGGNVTYMLTATNNDNQVASTTLTLTDTLPSGMTYVSSSAAGGSCTNANGTVTCTLVSLAPQATWQPAIKVKATTAGSIENTSSISGSQQDPNLANNSATVTTTVNEVTPPPSGGGGGAFGELSLLFLGLPYVLLRKRVRRARSSR
jgi:uncharacterized repeat protein (TIGR01451 family)